MSDDDASTIQKTVYCLKEEYQIYKQIMKRRLDTIKKDEEEQRQEQEKFHLIINKDIMLKPFLSFERIKHCEKTLNHYTGLPVFETFKLAYSLSINHGTHTS